MNFTRTEAFERLEQLSAAPVFLDSYRIKGLPEGLERYFGPPEEFFIASETQEPYTHGRLIPILDDGNFGIVTFSDPDRPTLVQFDVEQPQERHQQFDCWQQYLADLMIQVGESEDDDDRVRRIAEIIQFHHTDDLFTFFSVAGDLPYVEYDAARDRFIAGIAN